jgi:hypothetical protein
VFKQLIGGLWLRMGRRSINQAINSIIAVGNGKQEGMILGSSNSLHSFFFVIGVFLIMFDHSSYLKYLFKYVIL